MKKNIITNSGLEKVICIETFKVNDFQFFTHEHLNGQCIVVTELTTGHSVEDTCSSSSAGAKQRCEAKLKLLSNETIQNILTNAIENLTDLEIGYPVN